MSALCSRSLHCDRVYVSEIGIGGKFLPKPIQGFNTPCKENSDPHVSACQWSFQDAETLLCAHDLSQTQVSQS